MSTLSKARVLFVDDEPSLLSALRRMLFTQRDRWSMAFASGGQEALELMAREPFDLIVTDMRMPGMNGVALLREVQRLYPATERIVLSGYAEAEATSDALGVARQFLTKPCDPETLIRAIEHAVAA
jgi:YesN/AraC family two-component response regulator